MVLGLLSILHSFTKCISCSYMGMDESPIQRINQIYKTCVCALIWILKNSSLKLEVLQKTLLCCRVTEIMRGGDAPLPAVAQEAN